jgi:hypothetical protein
MNIPDSPVLSSIIGSIVGAVLTAWPLSVIGAYKFGQKRFKDRVMNEISYKQYRLVYVPLRTILINTHLVSSRSYIWSETRNFVRFLIYRIKICILSTSTQKKKIEREVEVEFGAFPLSEIIQVIREQEIWTDAQLLNLVQDVNRERYEHVGIQDNTWLTDAECALVDHIWKRYVHLNKKLMPR